jgi:hypothetical protein
MIRYRYVKLNWVSTKSGEYQVVIIGIIPSREFRTCRCSMQFRPMGDLEKVAIGFFF